MAEQDEGRNADFGGPVPADSGLAAVTLALAKKRGAKPDERLDALLESQRKLLDLQIENLREERTLQHRHLAFRYFGDRLRIGLQLLAIAVGLCAGDRLDHRHRAGSQGSTPELAGLRPRHGDGLQAAAEAAGLVAPATP
jgi:hypothetical protein